MPESVDGRLDYRARVLRAFVKDGRLVSIPSQAKKKLVVLEFLRDACFAENREYPEAEVNELLRRYNEDVAALRRFMVVEGLLTRADGIYRRAERDETAEPEGTAESAALPDPVSADASLDLVGD